MLIKTKDFRSVLAALKPAVSTRQNLPVLSHIRLSQTRETCHFMATDCDQWIVTHCPASGDVVPDCCIRFDKLERASKHWVAETVSLTAKDSAVEVVCGDYRLSMPFMPAAEMPEPPDFKGERGPVADFGSLLKRLAPFCSDNQTRPDLMSVHLGPNYLQASNGRALIRVASDFDGGGFLFPASAIGSVGTGEATLRIGPSTIEVTTGDTTLTTKRIEGEFPNTHPLMPDLSKRQGVNCGRMELLSAVEYCEGQSDAAAYANVWLEITPKLLTVRLSAKDGLPCAKEMPCTASEDLRVALSSSRLADVLRAFSDEDVTLTFDGTKEPLAVQQGGATAVLLLSRIDV